MQGSKRSIILRGPTQTSALQQSQSLHPGHPLCTPAWPPDVAPARPSSAPPTPWRAPRRRAGASGRAAGRGGRRRRPGSGRRVEKGFAIRRVPSWVDSWQSTQMLMLESWRVFQMLVPPRSGNFLFRDECRSYKLSNSHPDGDDTHGIHGHEEQWIAVEVSKAKRRQGRITQSGCPCSACFITVTGRSLSH